MEAINAWQKWYKEHQGVAELDEPLVTKDSRESLHDTSKTFDSMQAVEKSLYAPDYKQKAKEHFADTLVEFCNELTGAEFFEAFLSAAYEALEYSKKEMERNQELVDLLRCKSFKD